MDTRVELSEEQVEELGVWADALLLAWKDDRFGTVSRATAYDAIRDLLAAIRQLKEQRDEANARIEKLAGALSEDVLVEELHVDRSGFEAKFRHSVFPIVAEHAKEMLVGVDNYLEIKLQANDGEIFLLTLQRASGKSPADHNAELKAELSSLRSRLVTHRQQIAPRTRGTRRKRR